MTITKLTKIVATIGPSSESSEIMTKLIESGVDVFRFNTKHSTPEWHEEHILQAQKIADKLGVTLGILLDLQGPELRLETRDKQDIQVETDQIIQIGLTFAQDVPLIIPHNVIFSLLKKGDDLLIDDGFVETEVVSVSSDLLTVKVKNDTVIKHRKGVNLPGKEIDFPSLIDNDIAQIEKNARGKVDYVGLSFVRSAKDIELLRAEMDKRGMKAGVVAKIESQPALDRIDEIIASSDAVMVARGDLGIEVPIEQLAYWQKTIIHKSRLANKPVITATQMLESMIYNPRPTRAEATDIAHAVFDGTDAIMLSAETASGKYPVKTVSTMAKIASWNEKLRSPDQISYASSDATTTIAEAAVSIVRSALKPDIDRVVVFTETGFTAQAVARYHLPIPVLAVTDRQSTSERMALSYGITPIKVDFPTGELTDTQAIIKLLHKQNSIKKGETILLIHGQHWQKPGNTNALAILTV